MKYGFYRLMQAVLGTWYRLFLPARVDGLENIPPEDWEARIVRGAMEADRDHMLIRDGEKLY